MPIFLHTRLVARRRHIAACSLPMRLPTCLPRAWPARERLLADPCSNPCLGGVCPCRGPLVACRRPWHHRIHSTPRCLPVGLPPCLQGCCTAEACPYLHVNLPASAPICKRFLRGYCPAGAACPHKHYTLRMVREEKTLAASAAGAADKASKAGGAAKRGGRGEAARVG